MFLICLFSVCITFLFPCAVELLILGRKLFSKTLFNIKHCNSSGQCSSCGRTLESIHLSPEEYEFLKETIMRDVIDGGDQYKKTTPQVSLTGLLYS